MKTFQAFLEQIETASATIKIKGGGELWQAEIVEPDDRMLSGMGLTTSATGRSGWEALANLANHMKNAGFLD